ncbi:MAG: DUF1697 domain-containing protein [Dehalococcoidales bacterium]|jgi:uncharacterized protein (DUF1697 family)
MATYISLLRGINVSGQKKTGMPELAALYASLGLRNVRAYGQSGNVIFDSPRTDTNQLAGLIESKIEQVFKFTAAVLIRTPDELGRIIRDNPFLKERDIDTGRLHVTFLAAEPAAPALKNLKERPGTPDRFVLSGREIYLYCPNGYGRTKYSNNFFEKKLNLTATTRNWNTIKALFAITASQTDARK